MAGGATGAASRGSVLGAMAGVALGVPIGTAGCSGGVGGSADGPVGGAAKVVGHAVNSMSTSKSADTIRSVRVEGDPMGIGVLLQTTN